MKTVMFTDKQGTAFKVSTPDYGPDRNGLEKVSRNCYKGAPVHNIEQLITLARQQKAVLVDNGPGWRKISAANWMIQQPAEKVHEHLKHNRLFHVVKDEDF